jgi:hypothetical protein
MWRYWTAYPDETFLKILFQSAEADRFWFKNMAFRSELVVIPAGEAQDVLL